MPARICAALLAFLACLARAQAPAHTVEELLRPPVVRDVSLSPDGERLAIAGKFGGDRDVIAIADIDRSLEKAGKKVRYVEFPGQSHNDWSTKDEIRQIEEAIAFLKPLLDRRDAEPSP